MESSNLGNEVLNELMNVDQPTEVRQLFIGNVKYFKFALPSLTTDVASVSYTLAGH